MKRILLATSFLILASLACNLLVSPKNAQPTTTPSLPALDSEKRCGDGVCDGPEDSQSCPQDCPPASVPSDEGADEGAGGEATPLPTAESAPTEPAQSERPLAFGYLYSSVKLDRTAGNGDCGIDPWFSPDCTMGVKIWWDLHMEAYAATPLVIIPDGANRWVISNHSDVASKYGLQLSPATGVYRSISINPGLTNPECSATIEGSPFDFQVMGTRAEGLTELILSANPVEHIQGSCMQAGFDWETTHLLFGWAAALSGVPTNLRVQLNDTFKETTGQYTFKNSVDTNPSPQNRDHVVVELGLLCTQSAAAGDAAPAACPWE